VNTYKVEVAISRDFLHMTVEAEDEEAAENIAIAVALTQAHAEVEDIERVSK